VSAVIPPQLLSGALITVSTAQLYPLYELCGRAFSSISAHDDQVLGGVVLWIPSSMMSILGALLALWFWYRLSGAGRDEANPGQREYPKAEVERAAGRGRQA